MRLAGVALQHAQRLNVFPWIGGLELQKKVDMAWISSGYPGFQHATYISGFLGFRGSKPKIWVSDLQIFAVFGFNQFQTQSLQRISWWISGEVHV